MGYSYLRLRLYSSAGLQRPAAGETVGEAGWLRKAIAFGEAEHPVGGLGDADAVAGRHVQWPAAIAGAEDDADEVIVVPQVGARAGGGGGLFVIADESGLGAADGRQVEEEAEVAGETEASRVGEALAIDDEQVGRALQALERPKKGRDLAEGEEAGDVWEGDFGFHDGLLDGVEGGVGEEDDGGSGAGGHAAPVQEGEVAAGDETDVLRVAVRDDLGGEALLEGNGLGGGLGPGAKGWDSHGDIVASVRAGVSGCIARSEAPRMEPRGNGDLKIADAFSEDSVGDSGESHCGP
jgi:hypothetical protein